MLSFLHSLFQEDPPAPTAVSENLGGRRYMPPSRGIVQRRSFYPTTSPERRAFVFDVDITLTWKHSAGSPDTMTNYFYNGHDYTPVIKSLFRDIVNRGDYVFICTRGVQKLVIDMFIRLFGEDIMTLVTQFYGAENAQAVRDPYHNQDKTAVRNQIFGITGTYALNPQSLSTYMWAFKKKEMLDLISAQTGVKNSNVLFFDDTATNTQVANLHGYIGITVNDPDDTLSLARTFLT
jgi:hypothetical protein